MQGVGVLLDDMPGPSAESPADSPLPDEDEEGAKANPLAANLLPHTVTYT
jgi:hypothetical protein